MNAQNILTKIRLLGEAMMEPHLVYLSYRNESWQLTIGNNAWLSFGTPKSEIIDWLSELAIARDTAGFEVAAKPTWIMPEGIRVSGGERAPELHIALPGGLVMMEQYEALLTAVAQNLTLYGSDQGETHRRFCFADYMPAEWHQNRQRAREMKMKGARPYYGWDISGAKKLP